MEESASVKKRLYLRQRNFKYATGGSYPVSKIWPGSIQTFGATDYFIILKQKIVYKLLSSVTTLVIPLPTGKIIISMAF